jgi:protein phosphatase
MESYLKVRFALLTDTGLVRSHNEDAYAMDEAAGLFVVCDGMGGAAAGEIASKMASRVFLEQARQCVPGDAPAERLQQAAMSANAAVFAESQRSPERHGMGTTLVALKVDAEAGAVWTANVGDSRCYVLHAGTLRLLTEDHSYVEEQVRHGAMSEREARRSPMRNVITRAVGAHATVDVDVVSHAVVPGDVFLLCTDGLCGEVDEASVEAAMVAMGDDLQAGARALVRLANDAGGHDNVTVVLVQV